MAVYAGFDFGAVCSVATTFAPKRRQITQFPGVNGMVWKDLGTSGGQSVVTGWLYAPNVAALSVLETTLDNLQQAGRPDTFIDNYGRSIANTILDQFEPIGRVMPLDGGQGVGREFKCTLNHMG